MKAVDRWEDVCQFAKMFVFDTLYCYAADAVAAAASSATVKCKFSVAQR